MTIYEYSIAAGHNQAGSLVNIENITPSSDVPFFPPLAYNGFVRGIQRVRADLQTYLTGLQVVMWLFGAMTRAQWRYLRTTYTVGGNSYSGPVTIRTMHEDGSYHNYNAILVIKPINELDFRQTGYASVEVTFRKVVAI